MVAGVVSGIRVVDFSHHIAGPYCTMLFADWGAEVLKIERPGLGDPARTMGPYPGDVPHPEKSGTFLHLNTNKKSITLDLASTFAHEVVESLVRDADIVVESFRPGVMDRLGFGYDVLRSWNPDVVVTSITNFGQTGPYRDYKASELVLFGMGGPMNVMGLPDREPIKLGGNHVQYQAGNSAAAATLGAWFGRTYQGLPGQHIDVSVMETQMESINFRKVYLTSYAYRGERGSRQPVAALGYPAGFYPCSDGYVFMSGGGQYWPKTCALLGRPDLATDPKFGFPTGQFDPAAKEEFEGTIWIPWCLERTKVEVMEAAQSFGILCGAILTVEDAMLSDHYRERGYWTEIDHPVAGTMSYPGAPVVMTETPRSRPEPAPTLGQHNREIYVERLGYSDGDMVMLAAQGIV